MFFTQTLLLYAVIVTAIANLTYDTQDKTLWVSLLSSSLGYMLPAPSFKNIATHSTRNT